MNGEEDRGHSCHQVNVIRRPTIPDQQELIEGAMVTQQLQINAPVGIRGQDKSTNTPSLRNVAREVNGDHESEASHATQGSRSQLAQEPENVPRIPDSPWFPG
jgi:hypothetical protein